MIFWDSSGLVPLLVAEDESEYCIQTLSRDHEILIWCLTKVEIASALSRRRREGGLQPEQHQKVKKRLQLLMESAYHVTALEKTKSRALRLLEVHPLRAADACQLAAALVASQEDPERLAMICFDQRLKQAAMLEGFVVNP
ncbi:MAG: type II toxin-antitoxin system VapC family toxin [Desulfovermiculus sp.]